jgi:type IX secretion system substrate protein
MKKILLATFTFLIGLGTIQAQHTCGTSLQDQYDLRERLIQNRENAAHQGEAGQRNTTYYVPIKFHLVGKVDGSQVPNQGLALDMLCTLNEEYAEMDIQFYIKMPFNYIYHEGLYSNPRGVTGGAGGAAFQISSNKVQNALNIFINGTFYQEPSLLGYYQGPFPTFDYIVIKKSATYGSTAPHELGHFFSLAHPFYGWENPDNVGWNEAAHGNPVGTNAPSIGFQFPIKNEKQDQSNCTVAADAICDTPPDYLFAFSPGQNGCSAWNGGAMDPNGDIVDPIEVNMMSYFAPCTDYTFTEDQKAAIILDLESPQRNYIRPGYTPDLTEITEAPTLIEPIDGQVTSGYNAIGFDWNPVTGAQFYILEIDFLPTFSGTPRRYIVEGTYKVVEDFNANGTYYWRVRPFGEYFTCDTPYSSSGNFKAGSSVSVADIQGVNGWNVRPNPVSSNQLLNVEIDAAQTFDATVSLYSTAGQLMKTIINQNFGVGVTTLEISVADLSPGLYIVAISTVDGVMNKKVVVNP